MVRSDRKRSGEHRDRERQPAGELIARDPEHRESDRPENGENAAEHAGPHPTVEVTVTTTDQQTVITITDDGPGLPEDERQVLADGKEEPLVHGQGLGLYLAYWIITNLDGVVEVPKSQTGTPIAVRLPAAPTPG